MTVMTQEFVASCTNEAIEVKLYGVMNECRAVWSSEKSGGELYYGGYNLPPFFEIGLGYLLKGGGGTIFPCPLVSSALNVQLRQNWRLVFWRILWPESRHMGLYVCAMGWNQIWSIIYFIVTCRPLFFNNFLRIIILFFENSPAVFYSNKIPTGKYEE